MSKFSLLGWNCEENVWDPVNVEGLIVSMLFHSLGFLTDLFMPSKGAETSFVSLLFLPVDLYRLLDFLALLTEHIRWAVDQEGAGRGI